LVLIINEMKNATIKKPVKQIDQDSKPPEDVINYYLLSNVRNVCMNCIQL
jgi:hypothetical protein